MPFGTQTQWRREALPRPEILSYPLEGRAAPPGLEIPTPPKKPNVSVWGAPTPPGAPPPPTPPPNNTRRYLLAGTVLSKRVDNQYERYTAASGQNVAGILFDTVEF